MLELGAFRTLPLLTSALGVGRSAFSLSFFSLRSCFPNASRFLATDLRALNPHRLKRLRILTADSTDQRPSRLDFPPPPIRAHPCNLW